MPARLLRRLAATLLLVVGVSSAAFLVTHLAPGDVVQTTMGFGASQATIARAQHRIGLDRPLLVQWGAWLAGVARLDLGTSALYQRPVGPLVAERALNTALLATVAFLVALMLGIPPAFITATRPRSLAAHLIRVASLVLLSLPPFVGSLALVLVAARTAGSRRAA
jgi:peptide/nickel transport system permease protein